MSEINWQEKAVRAVTKVKKQLFHIHRGAKMWHKASGTLVVFANDGEPDANIEFMKAKCAKAGITIRGIAIDEEDHYSFAMLVDSTDVKQFNNWVWDSWMHYKGLNKRLMHLDENLN